VKEDEIWMRKKRKFRELKRRREENERGAGNK
jgi:hypothetical protein